MERKHEIVNRTVAVIEKNLTGELALENVAKAAHYSKYHLHRTFVQTVGMTVHSYIRRRRLSCAAEMLVYSHIPITQIAYCAGYETQQAFSGVFKAMYKKSPHAFRKAGVYYALQNPLTPDIWSIEDGADRVEAAGVRDIEAWMALVNTAVDGYPYFEERAYRRELAARIESGQALMLKRGETPVGGLLFDAKAGSIDFMCAHPFYRETAVYKKLIDGAAARMTQSGVLCTTTYRAGDKADTGYRQLLGALGFTPGELLTEFGYPTQRFLLVNAYSA